MSEKIEQGLAEDLAAADEAAPAGEAEGEAPEGAEPAAAEPESAAVVDEDIAALRDKYLALAQRTQADFENYKKRVARDVAAAEGRGLAKVVTGLLQALDHIAIAIDHLPEDEDDEAARALRNADAEIHAALARAGVESYSPDGEAFDPTVHEAMTQAQAEGVEPGTITAVYQRGYRAGGVVLRPARVVVAA